MLTEMKRLHHLLNEGWPIDDETAHHVIYVADDGNVTILLWESKTSCRPVTLEEDDFTLTAEQLVAAIKQDHIEEVEICQA